MNTSGQYETAFTLVADGAIGSAPGTTTLQMYVPTDSGWTGVIANVYATSAQPLPASGPPPPSTPPPPAEDAALQFVKLMAQETDYQNQHFMDSADANPTLLNAGIDDTGILDSLGIGNAAGVDAFGFGSNTFGGGSDPFNIIPSM